MSKGIDLTTLYHLRSDYTIIAITGRTCSGCSTVASQLSKGFGQGNEYPEPNMFPSPHNSYKKYDIVYRYAKENFKPYVLIKYRDVLTLFFLKYGFEAFIEFLKTEPINKSLSSIVMPEVHFENEIIAFDNLKERFEQLWKKVDFEEVYRETEDPDYKKKLFNIFFSEGFRKFTTEFHDILDSSFPMKRNRLLQKVANNLRKSGHPYSSESSDSLNTFTVVDLINDIIKSFRDRNDGKAQIVIDSLRNPMEVLYFKQRFAAFYLISVNRENKDRIENLEERYKCKYQYIEDFFEEEYKGGKGGEFYKQYVRDCIEKADIHITYRTEEECKSMNKVRTDEKDNTSPYFSWEMQLLKYVSLIQQPGLITPSPEERCMQMAYTAKYNSGCISRQVGAVVTDKFYSIKAIGWNNTPEGQVPCNLRNSEPLINSLSDKATTDASNTSKLEIFTPFERSNEDFKKVLLENYKVQIDTNRDKLKGRNVCFCFKALKNSYSEGKNQVHTRSLHAEESAFLQITKYGGAGIKDGKLFTSASPCELCSKKAYQLGIKVIYYVDPYPGISEDQILNTGFNKPELRLFNGAIGSAYHWLYEPLMAYKDELSLLLGQNISDLASKQREKIKSLEKRVITLEAEKKALEKQLED